MRHFEPLDVFTCPLHGIRQIEASAGTGKTWNICGLYLRLLLERGLDVQRILVVTFTNAATAELRERIRQRIVDTLAWLKPESGGGNVNGGDDFVERLVGSAQSVHGIAPADMIVRLELALATFDEAAIFTIHGFCQRALADTPFTAQMPLALELVRDDGRWVTEAANDFWRRNVAADDIDAGLAGHLLARKDTPERFARLLKRHLSKPMAHAIWPDRLAGALAFDDASLAELHAAARATWHVQREDIVDMLHRDLSALSAVSYKPEGLAIAAASWDELLRGADAQAALGVLGAKLELLGAAKLSKSTKKGQRTPSHPFFDLAQQLLELREQATQALALRRLALLRRLLAEGASAQRDAKRRQRVIAFDDMLFNLYERLTSGEATWLASALKTRFPAALIDEFQDTDPLQFSIFKTIYTSADDAAPELIGASEPTGDAPLFFVGDPKQAIYSFRNADLQTYLNAGDHALAHYSLAENQRSTGPLINALNRLFGANPRAFMLDGLGYNPVALGKKPRKALVDHSGVRRAPLQVWSLPDESDGGTPLFKPQADAAAVAATAAEIARLLAAAGRGEITLGDAQGARALAAGDIAVLVRSNAQGAVIRQALTALNVGSVELSQASVFSSTDALDLDRVLSAVLEPARAKTLKAALATEAMGLDAGAIDALADDESAMLDTVQRFAAYRDTWLQRGVGFMLRQWLADEHVTARLLSRPDGERRLTNLLHLVECLHEAAQQHASPDTLLRWFQSQRIAPEGDDSTQLRLESDQNLVQIVTVHKSKGLEYPIVFCPFLWGALRTGRGDGLDGVAYHDGEGRTVIDYGHDLLADDAKEDIKQRIRLDDAAESLRLVYVALTRAVHRCVLVAGCYLTQVGKTASTTASTRSLLNWLVAGGALPPADWFEHKQGDAAIHAAWRALAAGSSGDIDVSPLPTEPGVALRSPRGAPDSLAALPAPRVLPVGWWMGSFSALAHGARHDHSGVDHDLRAIDAEPASEAPGASPAAATSPEGSRLVLPSEQALDVAAEEDDPLRFPRGPAAGECMHQVFENITFTDPGTWPEAIAKAMRMLRTMGVDDPAPARAVAAAQAAALAPAPASLDDPPESLGARMLARLLANVLATPLPLDTPHPLRLADLPSSRRLVELEFHLPSHRLDAQSLNEALAAAGYPVPHLSFTALRGFLKGFIDLVFEHDGRYFILDWKSNHLGDSPAHYGRTSMAAAMSAQGYHLQSLLYTVALDRYLRHRLAGYRPEQHLGGSVYLFVRGMRPGSQEADGTPTGVFFHRPDATTIRRLSGLFDDARVPA